MKKQISNKIIVGAIVIGLLSGLIGGAITNEYLVAYLIDFIGGNSQEREPIVKRVVEEHVYLEDSKIVDTAAKVLKSVVQVNGFASGFIVTADGLIMTHQSNLRPENKVTLADGREYNADLSFQDEATKIAFLKIAEGQGDLLNLPVVAFADSNSLVLGQRVVVLGRSLNENVTAGVVTATDLDVISADGDLDYFYTDAAINAFNAGGVVVNLSGQVVGMSVPAAEGAADFFGVLSSNDIKHLLDSFLATSKAQWPYVGGRAVYVAEAYFKEKNLDFFAGLLLKSGIKDQPAVYAGSSLDKTGIKEGDVIVKVNGKDLPENATLHTMFLKYKPEDLVKLTVLRGGETLELELVVGGK